MAIMIIAIAITEAIAISFINLLLADLFIAIS
jgi:hypothetical protein